MNWCNNSSSRVFQDILFIGKKDLIKKKECKRAELKVLIMNLRSWGNLIHIFIQRLHVLVDMSQSHFSLSLTDNQFGIMNIFLIYV